MLVVLDTSVLVAGLRSQLGASAEILRRWNLREFQVAGTTAVFLEYEQVLRREEHRLPANFVDGFLSELAEIVVPVRIHFVWRPQLRDAGDEMVLEAAINGQAQAIVTHNRKDFSLGAARFGIAVLLPQEFLRHLQGRRETEW